MSFFNYDYKNNIRLNEMTNFPHRKNITLSGTGNNETNYIVKLNIHRGMPQGDLSGTDIFLNNGCKTDFSDVRFFDSLGNELEYYLQSYGNYEIIYDDSKLGKHTLVYNGKIYASEITGKNAGLYVSSDNGQTWKQLLSGTTVSLVYIDSRGYIFATKNDYIFQRSTDGGATWATVLDLTTVSGFIKWHNMVEDSSGNLYAGRYQESAGPLIYKSTDSGANWTTVYDGSSNAQLTHIHGVAYDPYTGYLYAGIDASAQNAKKMIRSVDGGANWTDLWVNIGADFVCALFPASGVRYFGGGNAASNCSLYKTTDDITFTPILPTGASIQDMQVLGTHIYALGTAVMANANAQIYQLNLDGTNPKTIWGGLFDATNGFNGYHNTSLAATPTAAYEQQLLLGTGNIGSYKCARLFDGGQHYQARLHIKIPNLPAAGMDISVVYGSSSASTKSSITIYNQPANVMDTPLLRMIMGEGSGTAVADSSGNNRNGVLTHTSGKGDWGNEQGRRCGSSYPWIMRSGKCYVFAAGDYIEIPTDSVFEALNKNFSVVTWVKTTATTVPQHIVGKGTGNYGWALQVRSAYNWVPGISYGYNSTSGVKSSPGTGAINNGEWHQVGVIFDNSSPVKVSFILDGRISTSQALTADPVTNDSSKLRIGADTAGLNAFTGSICDVQIYGYQLTQAQVTKLFENRPIATTEPAVVTTLV